MKKFIQSIENAIKAGEKKYPNFKSHTIRQDVVKRALERGAFLKAKCCHHLTDDYAWDSVNNFGKGEVSGEVIVDKMNSLGADRCYVEKKETHYEISIIIYQNLAYDVYVPLTADSTKTKKKNSRKTSSDTSKNLDNEIKKDTKKDLGIVEEVKTEIKKEIPKVTIKNNVIDATALFAKRAAV